MLYYVNPNYRYQFFSPETTSKDDAYPVPEDPQDPPNVPVDNEPSKRNLIGALKALYVAYGGEEELNNNAVDIIYKIANVINPTSDDDAPIHADPPPRDPSGGSKK